MKHLHILAAAAVFAAAAPAQAATLLVDSNGELTGAERVLIDGKFYDVTFAAGTCAAVFSGCDAVSDFAFTTAAQATAAINALADQVFIDGVAGNFDSVPAKTFHCSDTVQCLVNTPYALTSTQARAASFFNRAPETGDTVGLPIIPFTRDLSTSNNSIWAKFTVSPVAVPEPGTWAMMIGGFGMIGGLMRRRKVAVSYA